MVADLAEQDRAETREMMRQFAADIAAQRGADLEVAAEARMHDHARLPAEACQQVKLLQHNTQGATRANPVPIAKASAGTKRPWARPNNPNLPPAGADLKNSQGTAHAQNSWRVQMCGPCAPANRNISHPAKRTSGAAKMGRPENTR